VGASGCRWFQFAVNSVFPGFLLTATVAVGRIESLVPAYHLLRPFVNLRVVQTLPILGLSNCEYRAAAQPNTSGFINGLITHRLASPHAAHEMTTEIESAFAYIESDSSAISSDMLNSAPAGRIGAQSSQSDNADPAILRG